VAPRASLLGNRVESGLKARGDPSLLHRPFLGGGVPLSGLVDIVAV